MYDCDLLDRWLASWHSFVIVQIFLFFFYCCCCSVYLFFYFLLYVLFRICHVICVRVVCAQFLIFYIFIEVVIISLTIWSNTKAHIKVRKHHHYYCYYHCKKIVFFSYVAELNVKIIKLGYLNEFIFIYFFFKLIQLFISHTY